MRQAFRISFRLALIPALAALSLALPTAPAPAQETFVIPPDDGYGVAECMNASSACERTVADAWCAAMGRGPSVSLNATAPAPERTRTRDRAGFVVTCS